MSRRVAITGAGGQLGRQLVRSFADAGDDVLALSRPEFDITSAQDVKRLTHWRPDLVVNAAAWTNVDGCAGDPDRAMRVNGDAAGAIADAAARAQALIVQISTNEVFDGARAAQYTEDAAPAPINAYGVSKLAGERLVASANAHHLIVRTAWLFGPGGTNFVTKILAAAQRASAAGEALQVVDDEWGNPTWTVWLAGAVADAVRAIESGSLADRVLHLAGEPPVTRHAWAAHILRHRGVAIDAISLRGFARASRVPERAVLDTSRARELGIAPGDWVTPSDELIRAAAA